MNACDTCAYYQPKISYCEYYLRGKEIAVYLCPHCRSKNEESRPATKPDEEEGEE